MRQLFPSVALSEQTVRQAMETAVRSLSGPPDDCEGQGVVIPAGGYRYFASAYVCIRMLRELGCVLPIELWYLGRRELNDAMRRIIESLGVRCVDATRVPAKFQKCAGPNGGWELKSFALLHCRFAQVLLLDADNLPVVDPTFLFTCPQFLSQGAIFWPDYGRFGPRHPIWRLTGVPFRNEPEFESGQILVDKTRCFQPLQLAGWMNEESSFWYQLILGDKDTFHLAWRKLDVSYAMTEYPIETLDGTMCQHDFSGERIFQHHNYHKWNVDAQPTPIPGFLHMERCFAFLDELKAVWTDRPTRPYQSERATIAERQAAEILCDQKWIFSSANEGDRYLTFLGDGQIGKGWSLATQTWNLRHNGFDTALIIGGDKGIACRLTRHKKRWHGRMERSERFAALSPCESVKNTTSNKPAKRRVPLRPEDLQIAIATVSRQPEYVHTTLASLFVSGPEVRRIAGVHLLNGGADNSFLDSYTHHARIQIHPLNDDEVQSLTKLSVHQKACLNHVRCLGLPLRAAKGLCVCEDDIIFCDGFIGHLLEAINEIEQVIGLDRYVLSAYVPHPLNGSEIRSTKVAPYPRTTFYGSQCLYYPRAVAAALAIRMWENGVVTPKEPVDMIVKEFSRELQGLFGMRRSLVQHIGYQTTGLGHFHSSPTFETDAVLDLRGRMRTLQTAMHAAT